MRKGFVATSCFRDSADQFSAPMRRRCLCEIPRLGISETFIASLAQSRGDSSSGASETLGGKQIKIAVSLFFSVPRRRRP